MNENGSNLGAQQGDVVVGLAGAVGGVEVLADVVAGVGEEHVGDERDGARRALDVQHHASLRASSSRVSTRNRLANPGGEGDEAERSIG